MNMNETKTETGLTARLSPLGTGGGTAGQLARRGRQTCVYRKAYSNSTRVTRDPSHPIGVGNARQLFCL